jgi:hypothetical protein
MLKFLPSPRTLTPSLRYCSLPPPPSLPPSLTHSLRHCSSTPSSTWASYKEDYRRDHQRILSYNDPLAHKINGRVFKPDSFLLPTHDPLPFPVIHGFNLRGEEVKVPVDQTSEVKLVGLSLRGGFDYVVSVVCETCVICIVVVMWLRGGVGVVVSSSDSSRMSVVIISHHATCSHIIAYSDDVSED